MNHNTLAQFYGAVRASDEQELPAYRFYARQIYDQLVMHDAKNNVFDNQDTLPLPEILLPTMNLDKGIMLYDIATFVTDYPALTQKYIFNESMHVWTDRAACAFTESSWNVGAVILIPPGVNTGSVLDIRALLQPYRDAYSIEKILVIIETNAHIMIVDRVDMRDRQTHSIFRAIDYVVGDYASLSLSLVSQLNPTVCEYTRHTVHAGTRSTIKINTCMSGSAQSMVWLDGILLGRGANIQMHGVGVVSSQRNLQMRTQQHHIVAGGSSDVIIKSCVSGPGIFDYRGSIVIEQQADKTSAHQRNINLLLSNGARAYSVPNLEVINNNVECSHGSAVGQVDAHQLFYAQSRGMSVSRAQHLLVEGFLADIIDDSKGTDSALAMQEMIAGVIREAS